MATCDYSKAPSSSLVNTTGVTDWARAEELAECRPAEQLLADELAELGDEPLGIEGLAAVQAIQPALDDGLGFILPPIGDEAVAVVIPGQGAVDLGLFVVLVELGEVDHAVAPA